MHINVFYVKEERAYKINDITMSVQSIYINYYGVCLFVCNSRSPLPADQLWQMRYQKKAQSIEGRDCVFMTILSIDGSIDAKIGAAHYI